MIKIENPIYLDPLKANKVVVASERRSKFLPQVLSYEESFIIFKVEL